MRCGLRSLDRRRSRWRKMENTKIQWSVYHCLWLMTSSVWLWLSADISGKYLEILLTVLTQRVPSFMTSLCFWSKMSVFCWYLTRSCVRPAQLRLFLQTLCSVLRYRRTALSLSTEAGRLAFPPQPLSCSEALSLLRCWAFLAHNTALLTQIQDICDKHQLKELFGKCPWVVTFKFERCSESLFFYIHHIPCWLFSMTGRLGRFNVRHA